MTRAMTARAPVSPRRRALIAQAHIARKALALDEGSYRAVLARVTGHASSADCNDRQLDQVLDEFQRLGWQGRRETGRPASEKSWVRKIYAIWRDLAPLLDDADEAALRGFVVRQTRSRANPEGIADPEWLSPQEANKVIAGLQGWLEKTRQKGQVHVG